MLVFSNICPLPEPAVSRRLEVGSLESIISRMLKLIVEELQATQPATPAQHNPPKTTTSFYSSDSVTARMKYPRNAPDPLCSDLTFNAHPTE